ncbi:MAG TPA: flagellar basal body rod C-terminal domain-containing protein [Aliidongia sp.]|nr:flagellar basal body rod C-terminal domain-containing protein [Aliidongia sp.]
MSLLSILSNATNALLNSQAQINVVSTNIGNAQNPNYSQRSADVIDKTPQNGGGTQVVDVTRAVDNTLQNNYLGQTTNAAAANTVNQLYTQLEQLTGSSTASPVLSSALQTFQNAWAALQATPEDTTAQAQVLNSAQALVSTIQNVSHGVEQIAGQVTTQLGTDVSTLNSSLSQIASLNAQIVTGRNAGRDTTALEDTRDQLITTVAGLVPIQQQHNTDGSIYLSTPSGVTLVQQSGSSFAYDAGTDSLYNTNDPTKTSLNRALTNGQIGAEIGILANTGSQAASDVNSLNGYLGQLSTINAAVTAGTATPAQLAQQAALVTAIQAQLPATVTVGPNGEQYLSLPTVPPTPLADAAGAHPLAYNSTTNTVYLASDPTQASLNAALNPGTIATDVASFTPVANPTATGVGVLDKLRSQLNGLADLFYVPPPGTPSAFQAAYNPNATAGADFFSGTTGGSSDRFTLTLQATAATLNTSVATNVAAAFTATTTSFSAGGLSTGPTNYLGVANAIASNQSGSAAQATSNQTTAAANTSAAQQAYRSVTGVSSDQQLAQLVALQNAYSAAAKIISTVQELETTLLNAVGGA